AATGEGDLAGVQAQRLGTAGQQDLQATGAFDQGNQHGGLTQAGTGRQQAVEFTQVPGLGPGRLGQRMQGAGKAFQRVGTAHARSASRAGSTVSIRCSLSSSPICGQRAISATVRKQPSQMPWASSEHTPTQGLSTTR